MKRMHHKCGVLAIFALGLIVALSLCAAPALAADGCDCHTVEPLTAPSPHAPYVAAGADCTVCHVDWTVPHPSARPAALKVERAATDAGFELRGWVGAGFYLIALPHADVVVYLQERPAGAAMFTDVGQAVTGSDGRFALALASPAAYANYRAIAVGHLGKGVVVNPGKNPPIKIVVKLWLPTQSVALFETALTLRVKGLARGRIALGKPLTMTGAVTPAELAGDDVLLRFQRYHSRAPHWRSTMSRSCIIGATGDYAKMFTPRHRGRFRVRAVLNATDAYTGATTDWRQYRVK